LPKDLLSRASGRAARVRLPRPLQGRLNRLFAQLVGADLTEAERPPEDYASLSDFFVRGLAPGLRSWPVDPRDPGSPADGIIGAHGPIDRETALQAKGIEYGVADLLGSSEAAERFAGGAFLTIYLAPRHYHRVHTPCTGHLYLARRIPGRLFPVNAPATSSVRGLLVRNERLVALLEGDRVAVAVVAVGALNVGSISADFEADPVGARKGRRTGAPAANGPRGGTLGARSRDTVEKSYDPPLRLDAGDPLMTFHLGSTVVLLAKEKSGRPTELRQELRLGREITVGEPLLADDRSRC
jgi:phosphatidylserine decarboxylase